MADDTKTTDKKSEPYNPALVDDSDSYELARNKLKTEETVKTTEASSPEEDAPIAWAINAQTTAYEDTKPTNTAQRQHAQTLNTDDSSVTQDSSESDNDSVHTQRPEVRSFDDGETLTEESLGKTQVSSTESKQGGIVAGFDSGSRDNVEPSLNSELQHHTDASSNSGQSSTPAQLSNNRIGPPDFVVTPPQNETANEDKVVQLSGVLTVASQRPVSGLIWHLSNRDGAFGHIELTSDGHWSYVLNSASPSVQSLYEGQQVSEAFLITATDGFGTSRSAIITVQIVGSNDVPTLQIPPLTVIEDTPVTSGKLVGHDVDTDAILSYHCDTVIPGFTLYADGSYTFDPADKAYQSLPAAQKLDLDIPVVVTDQHGASTQQLFKVTVIGTNDAPVLSVSALQRVNEDSTILQGQLKSSDVDGGDIAIFSAPVPVPGFILHADGSYTFNPTNPAYQHLAAGEVQDIKIPVSVMDSRGGVDSGELIIQVVGTNDVPKLMAQPGFSLHEDDAVIKGQFTALDVDTTDTLTFSTPNPVHGFTLNSDGSYTFDPSVPAYQHLAPGDHVNLQIPILVSDGHGGTDTRVLQITVNGTDDVPIIAAMPKQTVVEDQTISGKMLATDVDDADKLTFSLPAPVDGLTMNPDGSYTFDASHSSYQHVQDGHRLDLSIPVSVADSHGQASMAILRIGITGTNDRAMVVGIDHAMGTVRDAHGGTLHVDGQLAVLDIDSGESLFQPQLLQGTFGILAIDPSGKWSYTADAHQPALSRLQGSQSLPEHFQVRTADGTVHDIDIAIKGQNTPAAFGGVNTGMTKEDVVGIASGKMSVSDPNAGESAFTPVDEDRPHGHFTLTADGSWTFTLNNQNSEVQQLAESGTVTERITVGSVDGTPHVVVINIIGTNDAPMIGGVATGSINEDATLGTVKGTLIDSDIDTGAKQTWSVVGNAQGTYGSLSIDPHTGEWSYTIDNSLAATQQLAEGQPEPDSFTVKVTDEHGASAMKTIVVTVNGTNDAPVISSAVSLPAGTEDTAVTLTSAQLLANASDVDIGDLAQLSIHNLQADHGTVADNGDGTFTFHPDANYTGEVHFTYDVQDPQGGSVSTSATLDLAAVNDLAQIRGDVTGGVKEDQNLNHHAGDPLDGFMKTSGKLTVADVDSGEDHFTMQRGVAGDNGYGVFTIAPSGAWIYYADPKQTAIQELGEGKTLTDTITVTSADGTPQQITVTITGSNDAPTVSADTTQHAADLGAIHEDTSKTFTEAELLQFVGASDVDASDSLHVTAVSSSQGTFTKDATSGDWTFTPGTNFHGDNVALTLTVNDGHTDVTAHGTIDVTPVTDAAKLDLVINAEQAVINFAGGGSDSCLEVLGIPNNKPLDALAVEFTVIGGNQLPKDGVLASFSTTNLQTVMAGGGFVVSSPRDLTISFGSLTPEEYHTGIDMTADQGSHRWSVLWNGDTGTLDVLKDGHLEYHQDNVQKGHALEGYDIDGYVGNIMSAAGGALSGNQLAWQGQLFDLSLVTAPVSPSQLANGPLRDISVPASMVLDLKAEGGQIIDSVSQTPIKINGQTSITQAVVDTKVIPPNPGALLHLNPTFTSPDPDDQVSSIHIGGFVAGTILDDGNGHSHTITSSSDSVDISRWTLTGLTAQLPQGDNTNMRISLNVETTGPDGTHAQSSTSSPVVLDTASPIPDAIIGGDSTLITEQGIVVHGVLTVQDTDSTQEHFIAQTDVDGQYGKFSIDAHGHWTYMPDVRANALAEGEPSKENFLITSADGTSQLVTVNLTGTNDAPTVTATDVTHAADLGETEQDTAKTFTESELLKLIGASDADASDTVHVIAVTSPHGSFTQVATSGDWTFTPAADYHGDDVAVTLTVNDGHTDVTAHGTIDVSPASSISIDSVDNSLEVQTSTTGGHQIHGANHPGNSNKFTPTAFETTSGDVTIHGSAIGLNDGTQVTVHLQDTLNPTNSFDLVGTVSGGQWRVTIDHTRVDNVGDHDWQVEATATNAAGTVVHTTTEIIDQGALTQNLTEGGAATSLDLLEGADGMAVSNLLYSLDGQNYSSTIPAGFRLAIDGHSLEVDPDNAAFNSLAEGAQQTVYVKYQLSETVNGAQETINQNAVITVTGTNDVPVVTATNSAPVDLGTTDEDTAKTFTEADLLHLVGAHDTDTADTLHVSSVSIEPSVGSFTHDTTTGAWTFTPAANFDGSHLPITIEVTDGTDTTTAHAAINVTPVADTPTLDISLGSVSLSADVPLATQVSVSASQTFLGHPFTDFNGMYGTPVLYGDPAVLAHVKGILAGGTMITLGAPVHDPVHGDGVQLPGAAACAAFVDNDGSGSVKMIFDNDAPAQMHFGVYYHGGDSFVNDYTNWGDFTIDRTPALGSGPSHDFSASMPEDSVLPLNLTIGDADNSEQLSVTISGVPAGASLNAGTNNHDGSWTLQPSELTGLQLTPAANWNGEIHLGITVTSTDGTSHAETTSNLKISVTPVEDLSTVSGEDHLDVTEGTASPGADLHIQDPDTPAATFINIDQQQGDLGYGVFSMRDGHWNFEPGPKALALPDGDHATDTVTFRTTDGAEHQVVVNITGADTESAFFGTLEYGLAKGVGREFTGGEQAFGSLTIIDPDTGSVQPTLPEFTGQIGDHGYGHFSMHSGQWTYLTDTAAVVPLKPGEVVRDTLTIQASDGREAVITVVITGGDSAPTVSGSVHLPNLGDESPVTITEAQLLSHATDIDLAATESLSVTGLSVDHGSITNHYDGTWTFTPEPSYTGSVHFSYQVQDEHHGITQASADLTIVDNDLVPTVTATDSAHAADLGNTAEDTTKTFTEADLLSKVGAHDADATDTLSISGITSPHGTFTKLASGEWEFTPEANYHGDDVAVSIQVSDGRLATTAQAVIDISSITDAATVSATAEGLHTLTTSVEVEVTHLADTIDVKIDPATMVPGKIDTADGRQFAFFPQGGVDPHLITGLVIDGHSVTGSPELITTTYSTTPDAVVFPGLDPDALVNAHTLTFTFAAGAPPTLDIQIQVDILASGSAAWDSFALNSPAFEEIHVDRSVVGHEMHDVQVQGSAEGQDIHLAITATPTDPDDHITAIKITGLPPGATLSAGTAHADGSYTLTPTQLTGLHLTPAEDWKGDVALHVQVTTSDGSHDATSESMLTLNIAPQADVLTPVVTAATAEEDTSIALHISLTGHEDTSETHTIRIEGVPSGGALSAGTKEADGSWTLTPAQLTGLSLTPPTDHDQSFTLTVTSVSTEHSGAAGQATASLSVTIHPHEDAPTVALNLDPVFNEDTRYTFQAADFGFRDVDHGDTLHHVTITGLPPANYGVLLLNGHAVAAGQAIAAADIEHLVFQPAADAWGHFSFGFTVSDGQQDSAEAHIGLRIENVNDAAVITGDTTASIVETAHMSVSGHLTAVDIDSPDGFQSEDRWDRSSIGTYGKFNIDASGHWTYRVTDDRIHGLPPGQVLTDSHTFHSEDGTAQVVTVTITTTNDNPYVSSAVTLPEETSGTPVTIHADALLAHARDDDLQAGEHLTIHNVHSNVGTVTDNGDGTFTLVPRPGYVGPINLNYDINDGQGGTGHGMAELNIHSPVVHSDTVASESVMEDQGVIDEHGGHFLGAAGVVSSDENGQAISFAGQTVTGDHGGSLLMTQLGGVWQARIDNDSSEVQGLNTGDSFVETFTVTDTDGNTHDIKITVEGTDEGAQVNPAPPASDEATGTLVEEAALISSDEPDSAISDYMQFAVTIDSAQLAGVDGSLSGSSDADSGALSGYLDVVGASPADLIEPVVMDHPAQEASADDVLASQADSVNPDDGSTQNDVDSLPVDIAQTTPEHQDVQVDV